MWSNLKKDYISISDAAGDKKVERVDLLIWRVEKGSDIFKDSTSNLAI